MTEKELSELSKDELVKVAVEAGLGTEDFIKSIKKENLITMLVAVGIRDGKIVEQDKVISSQSIQTKEAGNITTVNDLVKLKKVPVSGK